MSDISSSNILLTDAELSRAIQNFGEPPPIIDRWSRESIGRRPDIGNMIFEMAERIRKLEIEIDALKKVGFNV